MLTTMSFISILRISTRCGATHRQEMATGTSEQMAAVSSSLKASNPGRRMLKDSSINYDVINYNYSYTLMVRFYIGHDNVRFHGAIIVYEE